MAILDDSRSMVAFVAYLKRKGYARDAETRRLELRIKCEGGDLAAEEMYTALQGLEVFGVTPDFRWLSHTEALVWFNEEEPPALTEAFP